MLPCRLVEDLLLVCIVPEEVMNDAHISGGRARRRFR